MSVNDSNAPKGIPSSGEVSPGNTGSDRSINLLKNIKTSTSRTKSNSSVNELRNWFRTYIGSGGDFDNTGGNQTQANLSDWHGTGILGIGLRTTNETSSTYGVNDDAKIEIGGYFSEKFKYSFALNGTTKTATRGVSVTFTGLQGGTSTTGTEYTINVKTYNRDNQQALPVSKVKVRTAYNGAGRVRGTNTTGIKSFGTSNNPIDFTYSGGAGAGKTSNPLWLLIGKEDPGGRDYGPSFTYP